MKTQKSDTEKNHLVEEGKRKGIHKIYIKQCYLIA